MNLISVLFVSLVFCASRLEIENFIDRIRQLKGDELVCKGDLNLFESLGFDAICSVFSHFTNDFGWKKILFWYNPEERMPLEVLVGIVSGLRSFNEFQSSELGEFAILADFLCISGGGPERIGFQSRLYLFLENRIRNPSILARIKGLAAKSFRIIPGKEIGMDFSRWETEHYFDSVLEFIASLAQAPKISISNIMNDNCVRHIYSMLILNRRNLSSLELSDCQIFFFPSIILSMIAKNLKELRLKSLKSVEFESNVIFKDLKVFELVDCKIDWEILDTLQDCHTLEVFKIDCRASNQAPNVETLRRIISNNLSLKQLHLIEPVASL